MRIVADTNTVVSGLLWHGSPAELLDLARDGAFELFTSPELLAELEDVLLRSKFSSRAALMNATVHDLILGYAALAPVVLAPPIRPVILAEPDDDKVVACAVEAQADAIVTGDRHLLALGQYEGVRISSATQILAEIRS